MSKAVTRSRRLACKGSILSYGHGREQVLNSLVPSRPSNGVYTPVIPQTCRWPAPKAAPELADDEVHAWAVSLTVRDAIYRDLFNLLAPDERARAERFRL